MQLDRTEIVIRQRSTLELFDLSLQVLKRHWLAIAVSSALFGIPLLVLDSLATAWMLHENALDIAEQEGGSAGWRHLWHVATLYTLQFPLVSLPTTIYLGNRIFYQAMPVRLLLRRLWPIAGRCLLVLGIVQLGLVGLVAEMLVNRQVAFDFAIEFWFFILATGVALFNRSTNPFAPEILGLELCPLRSQPTGSQSGQPINSLRSQAGSSISYRVRSRALHRYTASQNLPRFFGAMFFGCALFCMLIGAQMFILGASTGHWSWNAWFDHCGLQLSLWCVGMFLAVFRFLSYLDNRIRLEGWEIELRLKAEAARLEASTSIVTGGDRVARFACCLVLAATLLPATTSRLTAGELTVEQAAQSLPISDWYDKQSERYRPPEVEPADDDPVRTAGSISQSPAATASDLSFDSQPQFATLPTGELAQLLQMLTFVLMAVALVVLMAWLTYYALRDYLPEKYRKQQSKQVSVDPARIADLPFESKPSSHDPLTAAEQAMRAGNHDEAIAYLLGYLLLALDQSRLIHLQRGKTNRMYLRELRSQPALAAIVNSAVLPFEASYFGKHTVTREQFMAAWQQLDTFHQRLQLAAKAVAPVSSISAVNTLSAIASLATAEAASNPNTQDHMPSKLTMGLLLGASCLSTAGCGSWAGPWAGDANPYGAVTSPDANRSLNGLGIHRKLWESQGAKCSTPTQLSPKLDQADVIVLVGQSYEPPGIEARRWLEQWLSAGDQRTLLYFGRGFNADILYRQQTLNELAGAQRQRAEELLALRQADELQLRWQQLPGNVFCDWFYIDAQRAMHDYEKFQSDLPGTGQIAEAFDADALEGRWPVGVALHPPDSQLWMDKLSHQIQQMSKAASAQSLPYESSSGSAQTDYESERALRHSHWRSGEYGGSEAWLDALRNPLESEVLLSAEDGQPLIFRLTSDGSPSGRLGTGQIVIVANGFPILNGSLVTPLGAQIGQHIIDICGPAERVALLAFDQRGLLMSEMEESGLSGAGLEMFTVWPLSAITMPAALLGIIVCAALWPILGRPQPLAQRSVSDLGLHVEAIGRLMSETHDRQYAASTIEEYFRKVRGETPPAWLSDELAEASPRVSPEGDISLPVA